MTAPYSVRKLGLKEQNMRPKTTAPGDPTPPAWRRQWARGEDSPYPPGTIGDIAL